MKRIKIALSAAALIAGALGSAFTVKPSTHASIGPYFYYHLNQSTGQLTALIGHVTQASAEGTIGCHNTGANTCALGYSSSIGTLPQTPPANPQDSFLTTKK